MHIFICFRNDIVKEGPGPGNVVIDTTIDVNRAPSVDYLAGAVENALWNTTWEVLITVKSREESSPARKAFTAFMSFIANHPYFERYVILSLLYFSFLYH